MDAGLVKTEEQLNCIHQFRSDDVEFFQAELEAMPDSIRGLTCSARHKCDALAKWSQQGLLQYAEEAFRQLKREIYISISASIQVGHNHA